MIRWGIIGAGNVCETKSAPAFNLVPRSRLTAVMRRNGAKARDYARRHGVPKWYDDAEKLIEDPEVDAVYVATPPHVHAQYAIMAMQAGKPVYVEKPMARTHEECQDMLKVSERAGIPLFVAYYRRALPNFLKINSLLEEGAIGQLRYVRITLNQQVDPALVADSEQNWRVQPEIAGGGYFYDLACHQLDLLDFFLGPIIKASGVKTNHAGLYPAEDMVSGQFSFEGNILGSGTWCFTTSPDSVSDETILVGSEGEIRYATFANLDVYLYRDGEVRHFPFDRSKHIQQPLIELIVKALHGDGACPSTGQSGARTNWVMEQMVY